MIYLKKNLVYLKRKINYILRMIVGWPHLLRRSQISIITKYLEAQKNDCVLDVGCNNGLLTSRINARLVVGLDPSDLIYEFENKMNRSAVQGDGFMMPFHDATFDRVLISSVLQMMPEGDGLLKECYRVLKGGGQLVLTVPVGYRYIPLIFNNTPINVFLRKWLHLPGDYEEFKRDLNRLHHVTGPGYFEEGTLADMVINTGFKIKAKSFCPRGIGSLCYESILFIKYCLGLSPSVGGFFPMLLFPIAYLDRFLSPQNKGCEILFSIVKD